MHLRFALAILALVLSVQHLPGQGWFNSNWQYRIPVTVTNAGGVLTDFQVKVDLGPSFFWDNTRADGADIRFT